MFTVQTFKEKGIAMKKILSILLITFLILSLFGCSNTPKYDPDKLLIVTTIFPPYDFVKQITKDHATVIMLLPPGSESHSYEPTPKDIITIQGCDLFIYNGGLSDSWVNTILDSISTPINTLKMIDMVELDTEETHLDHDDHEEEELEEYDEHVWTSIRNSIKIVQTITNKIVEIDEGNKEDYIKNSQSYIAELNTLDQAFTSFFSTAKKQPLIFGDRFPFLYFVKDYGLEYYAAFPGCGHETEPNAANIASLIDIVKKDSINYVFYIEFSNHIIADGIAEATGAKTALLHSCHNVSFEDIKNGATYLSLMQQNLSTLKEALK